MKVKTWALTYLPTSVEWLLETGVDNKPEC